MRGLSTRNSNSLPHKLSFRPDPDTEQREVEGVVEEPAVAFRCAPQSLPSAQPKGLTLVTLESNEQCSV